MPLLTVVNSILTFLRAGYPEGVPPQDYIPLVALLRRRLTDEEVNQVAQALIESDGTVSPDALREAISQVTRQEPSEDDIARVAAHLAAGGWPLADAHSL